VLLNRTVCVGTGNTYYKDLGSKLSGMLLAHSTAQHNTAQHNHDEVKLDAAQCNNGCYTRIR